MLSKNAPSEAAVRLNIADIGTDIVSVDNKMLKKRSEILSNSLDNNCMAPNTVSYKMFEFDKDKADIFE